MTNPLMTARAELSALRKERTRIAGLIRQEQRARDVSGGGQEFDARISLHRAARERVERRIADLSRVIDDMEIAA